jgi:phosphatidylserine decarboxylase
MSDSLAVLPQYLLPKKALTVLAGKIASARGGQWTTALIEWFVKRYQVNMSEAANPDLSSYATFNEFFTRPLKAGARPLAQADYICPVDGAISQFGRIEKDQIFQAKGHAYTTTALVGGDAALAAQFEEGEFATIYLSPKDYHRIHMPIAGTLTRMMYVPGDLFSVNPTTARGVPGLFARNERVVCVFDTAQGPAGAGAGGCHHCGQHGHHLARRGESAAQRTNQRMAVCGRQSRFGPGCRDGPLYAGLHRGHVVSRQFHHLQPEVVGRPAGAPG